jgi:hypothetical protein
MRNECNYVLAEEIEKLHKKIELLETQFRQLKYLWDLKEMKERGKETHTTVYVNNEKI